MTRKSKKSRAADGMGSVRKKTVTNKNGSQYEYWEGRITVGKYPDGRQKIRSVSGKTQAEVVKKIHEITGQLENQTYIDSSNMTVSEWLDIWSGNYLNHVVPNTAHEYKRKLELYVKPVIGRTALQKLTQIRVQTWVSSLSRSKEKGGKGLSPKTIKDIHGVLHNALGKAVSLRLIPFNPADGCSLPKIEKPKLQIFQLNDIEEFLRAIKGHVHETYYLTLLYTGMRESEGLGLTWDCVDFERNLLHVHKQLQKNRSTGSKDFVAPKDSEYRTLAAPQSLMDLLKEQQKLDEKKKAEFGADWQDLNLVFSNPAGGYLSYRTVYDCYKRIVTSIGKPDLRVHDLRHAFTAMALDNGDDIKTVQTNLGHATPEFTMRVYAYTTNAMKEASAERMEKRMQEFAARARGEDENDEKYMGNNMGNNFDGSNIINFSAIKAAKFG